MLYKGKSVIITICVLIGAILFSGFSVIIANLVKNDNNSERFLVDAYDFSSSSLTIGDDGFCKIDDDSYNNNYIFTISDLTGLKRFAGTVRGDTYNDGRTYSGKTVVLSENISVGGALSIGWYNDALIAFGERNRWFEGTFDGQNHTISNIDVGKYYFQQVVVDMNHNCYGLFTKLGSSAIVRNLKLSNVSCSGRSSVSSWGAIVGFSENAIIENCWIDGITSSFCSAGIFGDGVARINNCNVSSVTASSDFAHFGPASAVLSILFSVHDLCTEIQNSVFNNSNCILSGNVYEYGKQEINNMSNIRSVVNVSNSYLSNVGDNFINLSSISHTGGSGTTTWYYSSQYNAYPILRQFISWATINLNAGDGITLDKTSIQIPSDAFARFYTYFSGTTTSTPTHPQTSVASEATVTSNAISIYDQTSTATISPCYTFSKWTIQITRYVTWRYVEYVQPMALKPLPGGNGAWVSTIGNVSSVTCTAIATNNAVGIIFKAPTQYKDKDGNLKNIPNGVNDVRIVQYRTDNYETYENLTLQVDRTDDHGAAYLCGLESIPVVFESDYGKSGVYTSVYFQFNWIRVYFTIPKSSRYYIEGVRVHSVNVSDDTYYSTTSTRFHNHNESGAYVEVLLKEKTYNSSFQ